MKRILVGLAGVAALEAVLLRLGRRYGSTRAERARPLPGDGIVVDPTVVTDHAITIDAPPAAVWPWLVQVGWGRAGWYTPRWVDRLLFPANGPSATRIIPELQDLAVGSFVPDGPPETECGLHVVELEAERSLVLRSNSHLPRSWRDRGLATMDWTWAFVLEPLPGRRTRFAFRSRWTTSPWWLTLGGRLLLVPADFVMSRGMLRGVRARAEGRIARSPAGSAFGERARIDQLAEVLTALPWFVATPMLRQWHLRWGATDEEVAGPMPGDELLPVAHFVATRAITIGAPPERVWPWLVQVGVGRAGFYSYDLLDGFGRRSASSILPEHQRSAVGDVAAPMTPRPADETSFVVAEAEPPTRLVWAKPDSTWAWRLSRLPDGRTRLVTRLKQRYRRDRSSLLTVPLLEIGDFPMMRRMLLGIRGRAESSPPAQDPVDVSVG